jgi:hypothetical protein
VALGEGGKLLGHEKKERRKEGVRADVATDDFRLDNRRRGTVCRRKQLSDHRDTVANV